jgi:2-polyprenyl-6-methoxyphenol hydroxylase-like FAD-dependent oxidoreductase
MQVRNVLISGAGIAGPALALWLSRAGVRCTVVEKARALRTGGQAVDFRGRAQLDVLSRMGILEEVRALATHMGAQVMVDECGRRVGELPPAFMSGELEIVRGHLCRVLYEATRSSTEYVFDDSIRALSDDDDGVLVALEKGQVRRFDLVVGADGLRSCVRNLAFGPDETVVRFLGHYVASVHVPNHLGLCRNGVMMSAPGRGLLISNDGHTTTAIFVFRDERPGLEREPLAARKRRVAEAYAGLGWEVPRLLDALEQSEDFFFDAIARVDVDRYAHRRTVLLGDAAWGGTLGGGGTGLAVVGAYVLAGEIAAAGGDITVALDGYEQRIRRHASRCQRGVNHVGGFFAPPTRAHLFVRNLLYRIIASPLLVKRVTAAAANDFRLPSYALG